jgi:ribosomal protein S18 acetylase RimI-like enzyme
LSDVPIRLRDFRAADAREVDRVALAAFEQFKSHYSDWPAMAASVGGMTALAENGEIILAQRDDRIIGAVTYVAPGRPKPPCFDPAWPIIRMLVVDPDSRRSGAGRALTEECIRRARRDRSPVIALHTSPFMTVALSMYVTMGFELLRDGPPVFGAPTAVYLKRLSQAGPL